MRRPLYPIRLTSRQEQALNKIISTKTIEHRYYQRASILIGAALGKNNTAMSKELFLHRETVREWRKKWRKEGKKLKALEKEESDKNYYDAILEILADDPRPGAPPEFTPEQVCQIIAVSCEPLEKNDYPVSHWSAFLLRQEVIKRGIVENISVTQVGRFLKSGRHKTS